MLMVKDYARLMAGYWLMHTAVLLMPHQLAPSASGPTTGCDTQLSLSATFSADIGTDGKLEEQLEESSNYVSSDIEGT